VRHSFNRSFDNGSQFDPQWIFFHLRLTSTPVPYPIDSTRPSFARVCQKATPSTRQCPEYAPNSQRAQELRRNAGTTTAQCRFRTDATGEPRFITPKSSI
jgi:hypothetical protein